MIPPMGTWGTGIFDDDIACDIRDSYHQFIADGDTDTEALARITADVREGVDPPHFWLALTLWELGRLDDQTRIKAIGVIDSGSDLDQWRPPLAKDADFEERTKVLTNLKQQLQSPQKPRKKLRPSQKSPSKFQVGDIIQFSLATGKSVLFQVTSIAQTPTGDHPVAQRLDWIGTTPPPQDNIAKLPARKRSNPQAINARVLLSKFPWGTFDDTRLKIIAHISPTADPISEIFTSYGLQNLEKALADNFGLK
jgi:hypothetical protein